MWVTGPELLTFVGSSNPSAADSEWADVCAAAINDAIRYYLDYPDPDYGIGNEELIGAARLAASEMYRRRDAPFGTTGFTDLQTGGLIRLARDYLEGVKPVLFRYKSIAGLIA